jgi:hypothetical protein
MCIEQLASRVPARGAGSGKGIARKSALYPAGENDVAFMVIVKQPEQADNRGCRI